MQRLVYLLVLFMSSFSLETQASSTGFALRSSDTAVFADDAQVSAGESFETVVLVRGTLDFSGEAQEVVILGGKLVLHSGAKISKSLVVMGGSMVQEDGAHIVPESVDIKAPEGWYRLAMLAFPLVGLFFSGGLWFLTTGFWILCSWLTGLFLFWCFPNWQKRLNKGMDDEKLKGLLWGFLAVLCFVPGLLFLVISIIGIALIPLYITLFGLVYCISHIVGSAWLGRRLARHFPRPVKWEWSLLLGLTSSVVIGTLLPHVGKFLLISLSFIASGIVWKSWLRRKSMTV